MGFDLVSTACGSHGALFPATAAVVLAGSGVSWLRQHRRTQQRWQQELRRRVRRSSRESRRGSAYAYPEDSSPSKQSVADERLLFLDILEYQNARRMLRIMSNLLTGAVLVTAAQLQGADLVFDVLVIISLGLMWAQHQGDCRPIQSDRDFEDRISVAVAEAGCRSVADVNQKIDSHSFILRSLHRVTPLDRLSSRISFVLVHAFVFGTFGWFHVMKDSALHDLPMCGDKKSLEHVADFSPALLGQRAEALSLLVVWVLLVLGHMLAHRCDDCIRLTQQAKRRLVAHLIELGSKFTGKSTELAEILLGDLALRDALIRELSMSMLGISVLCGQTVLRPTNETPQIVAEAPKSKEVELPSPSAQPSEMSSLEVQPALEQHHADIAELRAEIQDELRHMSQLQESRFTEVLNASEALLSSIEKKAEREKARGSSKNDLKGKVGDFGVMEESVWESMPRASVNVPKAQRTKLADERGEVGRRRATVSALPPDKDSPEHFPNKQQLKKEQAKKEQPSQQAGRIRSKSVGGPAGRRGTLQVGDRMELVSKQNQNGNAAGDLQSMELPSPVQEPAARELDRRGQDLRSERQDLRFKPPDRYRNDESPAEASAAARKSAAMIPRSLPQATQDSTQDLARPVPEFERRVPERSDLPEMGLTGLAELNRRGPDLQSQRPGPTESLKDFTGPGFSGSRGDEVKFPQGEHDLLDSVLMSKDPLSRAQLKRASAQASFGAGPSGPSLLSPGVQGSPIPPWPEVTNQPEFKALAQRRASELAAQRAMRRASEGSMVSRTGPGPLPDGDFSF